MTHVRAILLASILLGVGLVALAPTGSAGCNSSPCAKVEQGYGGWCVSVLIDLGVYFGGTYCGPDIQICRPRGEPPRPDCG